MLAKLVFSAPVAAVLSYFITGFRAIDFTAAERISIEFILLGRIPGTEVYLQFEHLLVLLIALIWLPLIAWAYPRVKLIIDERLDYINQLELISL